MKYSFAILSVAGLVAAQAYGSDSSSAASASATASTLASAPASAASNVTASATGTSISNATASTTAAATATATASAASTSATPSFTMPSSISSTCSTFLTALNGAPGIQDCISPLLNSMASASVSSVCTAASSGGCSDSAIRTWLTDFKGNCTDELVTNPNKDVVSLYDVLYVVKPFTNAVCAKDENGKYCLSSLSSNSTAKAASGMANAAQTPLIGSDGTPDAEAFTNANILWIGANPTMDAADLCTTCTKNVLTSYIQWESSTPMANGIANSPLLSSQTSLWTAVQKVCPADFISGTLANAGASPGAANGASTSSPIKGVMAMLAIVAAGVMTF